MNPAYAFILGPHGRIGESRPCGSSQKPRSRPALQQDWGQIPFQITQPMAPDAASPASARLAGARERLLNLLAERAYRQGQFTLASGRTSPHYTNCKPVSLSGEGLERTRRNGGIPGEDRGGHGAWGGEGGQAVGGQAVGMEAAAALLARAATSLRRNRLESSRPAALRVSRPPSCRSTIATTRSTR